MRRRSYQGITRTLRLALTVTLVTGCAMKKAPEPREILFSEAHILPDSAELRSSADGPVVRTVTKAEALRIFRCENNWCEVEGSEGGPLWINAQLLSIPLDVVFEQMLGDVEPETHLEQQPLLGEVSGPPAQCPNREALNPRNDR